MSPSRLILAQPVAPGRETFQNYTLALDLAPLRADFTSDRSRLGSPLSTVPAAGPLQELGSHRLPKETTGMDSS